MGEVAGLWRRDIDPLRSRICVTSTAVELRGRVNRYAAAAGSSHLGDGHGVQRGVELAVPRGRVGVEPSRGW